MRFLFRIFNTDVYADKGALAIVSLIALYLLLFIKISVAGAILVALFFELSILAHEFGHILAGRCFGATFHKITVGLSYAKAWGRDNSNMPDAQKALVFFAGPLANFAIVILGYMFLYIIPPGDIKVAIKYTISINAMLFLINMIPIGQLDGAKIWSIYRRKQ